ncbi:MAG: hypothetical protein HQL76_12145 [Magnetococcales bacterium]|nr:hypothetical protein [Magnetococcales bacterium]
MDQHQQTTCWHCLVGTILKTLLEPVGIDVHSEVQVVSAPPKADLGWSAPVDSFERIGG